MADLIDFTKEKKEFDPVSGEMFDRICSLISEYAGEVSIVSVLGVLELVKIDVVGSSK